jgi:hypothetical protein
VPQNDTPSEPRCPSAARAAIAVPSAPAAPLPAFNATFFQTTLFDWATSAAMLLSPGFAPAADSNEKSSMRNPSFNDCTLSAIGSGLTMFARLCAVYVQSAQSKPPNNAAPSTLASTVSDSLNGPWVAQANNRFVPACATKMAFPSVAKGRNRDPSPFESLPFGETNTPKRSSIEQDATLGPLLASHG